MGKYSSSPTWASITPIPLDDGSNYISPSAGATEGSAAQQQQITPLATIAYTPEYEEATAYLRAVMAQDEMSDRALELTEDVIKLNPAHYTVWLYRAKILFSLNKDLNEELAWLKKISFKYLKNYQIWHHRQLLLSSTTWFPTLPASEPDFLKSMFDLDEKNYHVWTYRHWLVRHFKLWDSPREIQDVERLIDSDVRNNSAWNHRWMLKFGPRGDVDGGMPESSTSGGGSLLDVVDEELVDAEVNYARDKILLAPQNKSPWAYVRGVLRVSGRGLGELKEFAESFVTIATAEADGEQQVSVKSGHALEWLADVYAEEAKVEAEKESLAATEAISSRSEDWKTEALKMLTLLKEKYDPIRKNYWDYRIRALEL